MWNVTRRIQNGLFRALPCTGKRGEHYTQCYLKNEIWDRGEGNALVPTVRMPGMRTWNKYCNVPLEERIPYNETGDMWGINRTNPDSSKVLIPYKESGHMIRSNNVEILTLAEEAAFLYWVTGQETYAIFATDIFQTWLIGTYYMNPILDPEQSSKGKGGYEPGGICGYYDYEQIHDDLAFHAAIIYDFMHDYLLQHPHPHFKEMGKGVVEVAGVVFKRFIDIGFVRGGKSGNWNVNRWNMMLRPILVLEENDCYTDRKGYSYYLHYLITESTPYHDAIPDMLKSYDPITGLWPESPGYSFATVSMLLEFSALLKRCDIDILADNPILQKAALAIFPWIDERGNMIIFGDSRGGTANFETLERLLSYYMQVGDQQNVGRVSTALSIGIANGNYHRENAGWTALCTYVSDVPKDSGESVMERMSYSPHHRLVTMKSRRDEENLMAVLYGGRNGYHLSPNGLALQLYGFGYALAPDAAGYESYWSKDHKYHQSATGSNTILPEYTEGEVTIRLMEPTVQMTDFTNTYALNPFINVCDMEAGEKRRVVALVKTNANNGYYVDIFRSDQPDNDYLFHNVGISLGIEDADGRQLPLEHIAGFDKVYGIGYDWFKNLRKISYSNDFKAIWQITSGEQPLSMHLWMVGSEGRKLYGMEAPYTTLMHGLTPENVSAAPLVTPTLLVRQTGNNAWSAPFIAVFQPVRGSSPSVHSVKRLVVDEEKVVLCISSKENRKEYFFSGTSSSVTFPSVEKIRFQGALGLVTDVEGQVSQLYMVDAKEISKGGIH